LLLASRHVILHRHERTPADTFAFSGNSTSFIKILGGSGAELQIAITGGRFVKKPQKWKSSVGDFLLFVGWISGMASGWLAGYLAYKATPSEGGVALLYAVLGATLNPAFCVGVPVGTYLSAKGREAADAVGKSTPDSG
jgi:hypothetical protein